MNTREKNSTPGAILRRIEHVEEGIAHDLAKLDTADRQEDDVAEMRTTLGRAAKRTSTFTGTPRLAVIATSGRNARLSPTPRWEHERVLDAMQHRLDHMPDTMRFRRQTVGHVLARSENGPAPSRLLKKASRFVRFVIHST